MEEERKAGLSSGAWNRKKESVRSQSPGHVSEVSDEQLLEEIRNELQQSSFHGEGYKKIWYRLKKRGIMAAKEQARAALYRTIWQNVVSL